MSHQKLSRSETTSNIKIKREVERLKQLMYTRKMDEKDKTYINNMIKQLETMLR